MPTCQTHFSEAANRCQGSQTVSMLCVDCCWAPNHDLHFTSISIIHCTRCCETRWLSIIQYVSKVSDNWVQAGAEGERNKVVLAEAPERERETGKLCSSVTASQAPFREHNIAGNNTFSCKMSRLSRIYPSKIEKTLYLWKSLLCKIPNQGTPISVLTAHGSSGFNCPQSLISTFILVVIIVMMMKIITIITIDGVEGPLSPTLEFPGLVGPASWGLGAGWWGWWW